MNKEELKQAAKEQSMIYLFNAVANAWYLHFTIKSFDELREYLSFKKSSWTNGLRGDEWETLTECLNAAIDAADFVLEEEQVE